MHVSFTVEGDERELDLDIGQGQPTVGDLYTALTGSPDVSGLLVDRKYWPAETLLADVGLRQGAALAPAAGPAADRAAEPPPAVLAVTGGLGSGPTLPLATGSQLLGSAPDADVVLDDPTLSPVHARIDVTDAGAVAVADAGSKNGTALEGYRLTQPIRVDPGQVIQAGAVLFRVGPPPSADAPVLGKPRRSGTAAFNRPPRAITQASLPTLRTPAPPKEGRASSGFSLASMVAPAIFGLGTFAMTKKPIMAVFALLSPVMLLTNRMEEKRRAGQEKTRGDKEFFEALLAFRRALLSGRQAELARRRATFPDPAEVLRRAVTPSVRLWERRPGHEDFLQASVGAATQAWTPPLDSPSGEHPPEVEETINKLGWLPNAPLAVNLTPRHTLGVVGDRKAALALARSVICQLAVHHGPADLRVAVLTDPSQAADWDWAKWLPHVRSLDESSGRHLLGAAVEDVAAILDELTSVPDKGRGVRPDEAAEGPVTLVVVDAPRLLEGRNSLARDVLAGEGVPACGLVLVPSADQLPALSTSVVELSGGKGAARYREPSINLTIENVVVTGMPEDLARQAGRALSGLEDPEVPDLGADLPDGVALVDLIGGEVTPEAIIRRWKSGGRVPRMIGPLGVAGDGPVEIDWVADGPHALIAGTTGSGKSELLRSVVAGLAASLDSDHLNFVLIDYKGGSAFAQCAGLPHTVGMVTDLDEHLGARALHSLEAELHYRETRLRDAGASDLKQYLQDGHPEPLPRLLVIIDEFATMAAELPDFINSLVGIAQRGRSLGVHMILATQRPGGAVNDNIRANTNLRISLRVQEAAESSDIIGTPVAAQIGRRQAGRGYVRLGASDVFPFQAALVTGVTRKDESTSVGVSRLVFGPEPLVRDELPDATTTAAPEGPSDLERLVAAASEAARLAGLAEPRRPWPEELPGLVTLDELQAAAGGETAAVVGVGACFALADEPDRQRRALFSWSPTSGNLFVCGVTGSGATTTLATIAISLAKTYRPEKLWFYGLDFGTQNLAPLTGLPHCGGIVGPSDRERQFRLVRWLGDELERRRRHIAATGAARIDPGDPNSPFPTVVLLIDNYGALHSALEDSTGMAIRDLLVRTIADGPGLGVVAAIAADRPLSLPGNISSVTPNKIALRLAEPSDLSFFGLNPREVGKLGVGRGIDAGTKLEVQVAVPHAEGLAAAVTEVAAAAGTVDDASRPPAIGTLPDDVPASLVQDSLRLDETEWYLPLGVGDLTLGPTGLRLLESEHAFIIGPPRSGKSTVLDALASMVGKLRPDVVITVIGTRRSPLHDAPEVKYIVRGAEELKEAVARIKADTAAPQLVLIDDADALDDDLDGTLAGLVATPRPDVHLVVAARPDPIRSNYGHWTARVRTSRQGLALRPNLDQDGNLLGTMFPRGGPTTFEAGRGYLVAEGVSQLLQAARRD
jgi:S-DNA-T family DNA segregation ATPase FtsK/SpoIIIE